MKLYKAEAAIIAVTDGTISAHRHRPPHRHRQPPPPRPSSSSPARARRPPGQRRRSRSPQPTPTATPTPTYTGAHNLTFSGANSSTNPVTAPTVTDNAAAAINFGSTTAITFTSGVATSGGSMKLYKAEAAIVAVTDGTHQRHRHRPAHGHRQPRRRHASSSSPARPRQTAGAAQTLTITATDPYGNTDTAYTGAKNLTFSGANSSHQPGHRTDGHQQRRRRTIAFGSHDRDHLHQRRLHHAAAR